MISVRPASTWTALVLLLAAQVTSLVPCCCGSDDERLDSTPAGADSSAGYSCCRVAREAETARSGPAGCPCERHRAPVLEPVDAGRSEGLVAEAKGAAGDPIGLAGAVMAGEDPRGLPGDRRRWPGPPVHLVCRVLRI